MSLFVIAAGTVMWFLIPTIYGGNYDAESISLGQTIFVIFVLASVFHMMTDAFSGCENLFYVRLPAGLELPEDAFPQHPVILDRFPE